jgi:hypothetical protein
MATNEFLYAKDDTAAAEYYNLAAETPGVPAYAERFSLNFGIETNQRQKTEQLWETIMASTNDPDEKARAQAYIDHLQDFIKKNVAYSRHPPQSSCRRGSFRPCQWTRSALRLSFRRTARRRLI